MPELRITADDFQVGDLVHRGDVTRIEIRSITRRDGGVLAVNEGDADEMHGFAWQHATVTRPEPATSP
ncbi:hypothetical protein [Streptomyces sp. NPDC057293]|uniref:hypothetical protein n=1 Tax=unclassified Streptomyces TaxID=2593676 RepID=UPI00363763E1